MKKIAYLRVSKDTQDVKNQRLSILDYSNKKKLKIDQFYEYKVSSRKSVKERGLDDLIEILKKGDTLIVSELSRLGRSVGQIITFTDKLIKEGINLIAIKENIKINKEKDLQTKVMITMFSLFAEIERDLISIRTKEGLAAAKASGKQLGRPAGTYTSKLDDRKDEIKGYLDKGVSITSIAKILEVSKSTLYYYLNKKVQRGNNNGSDRVIKS